VPEEPVSTTTEKLVVLIGVTLLTGFPPRYTLACETLKKLLPFIVTVAPSAAELGLIAVNKGLALNVRGPEDTAQPVLLHTCNRPVAPAPTVIRTESSLIGIIAVAATGVALKPNVAEVREPRLFPLTNTVLPDPMSAVETEVITGADSVTVNETVVVTTVPDPGNRADTRTSCNPSTAEAGTLAST
jgi:hypothetical protein